MEFDLVFWSFIVRWLHVIAGVMWIGLLWYFNFVEVPAFAEMSDEEKLVVSKHIAPRAMFWFRHAAMSTMVFGLLLAWMQGYIWDALALGLTTEAAVDAIIGFGMWLGLIMWFNVEAFIWPNHKKVVGMVEATPERKKASARRALMALRTNAALSIPLLFAMLGMRHLAEFGVFG